MTGMSAQGTKNFTASGALGARLIAKLGAADYLAAVAALATDEIIGVSSEIAAATGEPVDIFTDGIREVIYGGTVPRGAKLTSDASGKAIDATGVPNAEILGIAMVAGVANDIGLVKLAPSSKLGTVQIQFTIPQVELLAGTGIEVISPVAGVISKASGIVQTAITTGGPLTFNVGTTPVDGLTLTFADAATKGTIVTDTPTSGHATTVVAVGDRITIVPDAAFATAGAIAGFIDITV